MLEQQVVIGARTVLEDGQIQVREDTWVVNTATGERVAGPKYHRYVIAPGDDVSQRPVLVRRLTDIEWTPAVLAAYRAKTEIRN